MPVMKHVKDRTEKHLWHFTGRQYKNKEAKAGELSHLNV
jgi:hypothetical protein